MKNIRFKISIVLLALLCSVGYAEYVYEDDVYIGVCTDEALTAYVDDLLGTLSEEMFEFQEGVHEEVGETTGEEIDHYYIWIGHCDQYIPIYPFHFQD